MYIDTHAHLDFPELRPHLDAVFSNARLAGVHEIITIGIDAVTNRNALQIARDNPGIYAAIGWHPHEAAKADASLEEQVKSLANDPKVVAIGEIGLDYYRDYAPRERQKKVFARMIAIASELDLPIVIHCRDAFGDVLDILRSEMQANTRGVFHCFSGSEEDLRQVLDLNFYVSYTGNVTYKKTPLISTVQATPAERLLLETDCPFLTPHPHRGKRNEPAYIPLIATKLAEIKGMTVEDLRDQARENTHRLFNLQSE